MKKNICGISDEYLKLSGLTSLFNQYSKSVFTCCYLTDLCYGDLNALDENDRNRYNYHNSKIKMLDYSKLNQLRDECPDAILRLKTIQNNDSHRYRRLYKYIENMLKLYPNNTYFLTLTFRDDVIKKYQCNGGYKLDNISKLVKRFLNNQCEQYIANIDFGLTDKYIDRRGVERVGTHRLHYHAVIIPKPLNDNLIDLKLWYKKYGICNIEKIKATTTDSKKLGHYITKLTNHAIKESVKDNRVIYSKYIKYVLYDENIYKMLYDR